MRIQNRKKPIATQAAKTGLTEEKAMTYLKLLMLVALVDTATKREEKRKTYAGRSI